VADETIPDELPAEPSARVRAVLERIVGELGLEGTVDVSEDAEAITASVEGEDLGLLIGRRGQTIDAVQLLCYQAAFRGQSERKRVIVDAAGYREHRREILEQRSDRAAEDALRSHRPVELEAMSAQERRVVHDHLKDRAGVETYSEGDEPDRRVIVAPVVAE
jgi:spoIIIJ-associated protein